MAAMTQVLILVLITSSFVSCSVDPNQGKSKKGSESDLSADATRDTGNEEKVNSENTDDESSFDLIGGVVANPTEYTASVRISSGNSSCTATVVGKRTVITAAHCVSNGGTIRFAAAGKNYSAACSHHQNYRQNSTADWALCKTNADVTGIAFEIVNTKPDLLKQGANIQLSGYGCRQAGGRGGSDGRYRIGDSNIVRVPAPTSTNHDIVTRGQGAALCFGDSGGPAFLYLDSDRKERVLIGVNSRGDIRTTSYLSSVSQATAITWMKAWADTNAVEICGISPNAQSCRAITGDEVQISAECKAMEAQNAIEQLTKCARVDAEIAEVCDGAQELVLACVSTRVK
jgi:hypothetical protein